MEQWLDATGRSMCAAGQLWSDCMPAHLPRQLLCCREVQITDMVSRARRSARRWSSGWMRPARACPLPGSP